MVQSIRRQPELIERFVLQPEQIDNWCLQEQHRLHYFLNPITEHLLFSKSVKHPVCHLVFDTFSHPADLQQIPVYLFLNKVQWLFCLSSKHTTGINCSCYQKCGKPQYG